MEPFASCVQRLKRGQSSLQPERSRQPRPNPAGRPITASIGVGIENCCTGTGSDPVSVYTVRGKVHEVARNVVLDDWVNGIQPAIVGFEGYEYPDGIRLEFTPETVRALNEQAHRVLDDTSDVLDTETRDYVRTVMAYLGESLLTIVGGQWSWDDGPGFAQRARPSIDDQAVISQIAHEQWAWPERPVSSSPGLPIIVPDAALGLEPLSPLHLVLAAMAPGGNDAWMTIHDEWSSVANEYRTAHPGWVPLATQTPGFGGIPTTPPSAILDTWLAERAEDFPRWSESYPGTWDFTEESLDRLIALISPVVHTEQELSAADNRDLIEGAVWYFGETMCRGPRNVRWIYRPKKVRPGDPDFVAFGLELTGDVALSTPAWTILLVLTGKYESLSSQYSAWHN